MRQKPPEDNHPASKQEFMTLIPRGKGFPTRNPEKQSTSAQPSISPRLEQYQNQFLHDCGYQSNDLNEQERLLYIKTLFILRNRKALEASSKSKALLLLVADQESLFNDADPKYRNRMQNMAFFSGQRKRKREVSVPCKCNSLIEEVITNVNRLDGKEAELAKLLMEEIVKASEKRGIYRWVFSGRHIRLNDSNQDEYLDKFLCFQEQFGNLPADKSLRETTLDAWLHDSVKVQKLIGLCLSEKNPNNVLLLDLPSLKKSCIDLLERAKGTAYLPVFTDHFFNIFVSFVLREYMVQLYSIRSNATPVSLYRLINVSEFYKFERRYSRLCELQTKFNDLSPLNEVIAAINCWEFPTPSELETSEGFKTPDTEDKIIHAIRTFFMRLGTPLTDDNCSLSARVRRIPDCFGKDSSLLPIVILLMVLCCGRRVARNMDVESDLKRLPPAFKGINRAKQRYEELLLLESLCRVFDVDKIQNLSEYLKLRGKQIYSRDEYVFWCKVLHGKYERLPQIGFQLCYINYCTQCLPPNYATLCYVSTSALHLGGYYEFWLKNKNRIFRAARDLPKQDIYAYKVLWGKPRSNAEAIRTMIQQSSLMKIDLKDYIVDPQYDPEELKCLLVETMLRIRLYREARCALLKAFCTIGSFPLVNAVYHRLEPSQGGFPIK